MASDLLGEWLDGQDLCKFQRLVQAGTASPCLHQDNDVVVQSGWGPV